MLGKVIAVLVARKTAPAGILLMQRLLAGVAAALALIMLVALLIGSLILGGIYLGYQLLLTGGYDPQSAIAVLSGVVLALILLFSFSAYLCIRGLKDLPGRILTTEAPLTYRATRVANAFVDGLLSPRS